MEAYTAFAKVYDKFMENVPYELWADFIDMCIKKYGITKPSRTATDPLESERNLVLDMGCGTGRLTKIMYDKGYDMMGVDYSAEMLDEARCVLDSEVLLLCQDMCELDLYSTVGTIYAACDSINYLLDDEDIRECFKRVANYLYPGGIFVFDINTVYKYRDVIGESTIAENADECSFIWENYYDEDSNINEYDLTLFIKDDNDKYDKSVETHLQRGYTIEEIYNYLEEAGLDVALVVDEEALEDVVADGVNTIEKGLMSTYENDKTCVSISDESQRIFIVAKKLA